LAESTGSASAKLFFSALYYFLPNFSFFMFITNAAHGALPDFKYLAGAAVYSAVYVCILLACSSFIFSRRNFK
jgi:hypothetical protein